MHFVKQVWPLISLVALVVLTTACGTSPAVGSTGASAGATTGATASTPSAAQDLPVAATPAETSAAMVAGGGNTPVVFAAASLTDAFKEIGKNFEAANTGVGVTFNFGSSSQLAQQIKEGAPADLFASANRQQMNVVIESGQVSNGTERIFVRNRLVVIYPKDNPANMKELKDLARAGVKFVTTAREVPVGQYTLDFLDKASKDAAFGSSFKEDVLKNVVSYEENVRAVLSKVVLGEADAGIVYTSDIVGDAAGNVGRIDIPDALNTIATYPIAPIKGSKNAELAQKFLDYVLTPEAQEVLEKYGFIPVVEGE